LQSFAQMRNPSSSASASFAGTAGYTLADTHLNSFVDWLRMMKVDLSAYARLNAWGERCAARPAHAALMSAGAG